MLVPNIWQLVIAGYVYDFPVFMLSRSAELPNIGDLDSTGIGAKAGGLPITGTTDLTRVSETSPRAGRCRIDVSANPLRRASTRSVALSIMWRPLGRADGHCVTA